VYWPKTKLAWSINALKNLNPLNHHRETPNLTATFHLVSLFALNAPSPAGEQNSRQNRQFAMAMSMDDTQNGNI
jgi:hypothetical protein